MARTFRKFAGDELGFIISAELVMVMTIAVLGLVVGLAEVRDAVTNELNDVAHAFGAVSQTYHVSGLTKSCHNWNDIAHTHGTVSQTCHGADWMQNCHNCNDSAHRHGTVSQTHHEADWTNDRHHWRAHASISGFGFNDYADESDWNPIRYSDVCGKIEPIREDND